VSTYTKKMLKFFASLARPMKPLLEALSQLECLIAGIWAAHAHFRLQCIQWGIPPTPEHFDHHIDLFYHWRSSRNPLWIERGVFGALALKGGDLLELACGDGFNARNFYSLLSKNITACDFDPSAIKIAKRKNSAPNVTYQLADIRTHMPEGHFDNVVWDAAIEHFTCDEIAGIMENIKSRLKPDGILSGYTLVERHDKVKHLIHHEYEFKSKEDLARFFEPHFQHITVFETIYPVRHNLYFWASDGDLPFSANWKHLFSVSREAYLTTPFCETFQAETRSAFDKP
jgi:SAM-dependent methyltransferase